MVEGAAGGAAEVEDAGTGGALDAERTGGAAAAAAAAAAGVIAEVSPVAAGTASGDDDDARGLELLTTVVGACTSVVGASTSSPGCGTCAALVSPTATGLLVSQLLLTESPLRVDGTDDRSHAD